MAKLTAKQIENLSEPGYYNDGEVTGLYLQISKAGTKSWVLRYRFGGKTREMGLGGLADKTLAKARDAAREARTMVADGKDPIEARKAAKREAEAQKTFKQCAAFVIEQKSHELTNPKSVEAWTATLDAYVYPHFGERLIGEITKYDVQNALKPIWHSKHESAKRILGRIKAVFDYAKAHDYCSGDNPADWHGAHKHLLGRVDTGDNHHEAMDYRKVGEFMVELRDRAGIIARALEFVILTATRSGEVRGATRDEIDFTAKVWVIPAERMKARKEHRVPLSNQAIALLKSMPKIEGTDLLFPAPYGGELRAASMVEELARMGRKGITAHGFRSTFRDWAGETTAYPREVIEHALAHLLKDKAEAAYARGDLLTKRARLMAEWATYCDQVQNEQTDNVIALNAA